MAATSGSFGRKIAVVIFAAGTSIFNIMSAFSPSAEVFLLARCLVGASNIAYYTTGLILNTELVHKHQRKVPRTVLSLSISTIMIGFVGVTYVLRDHRYLQCYISAAMALATVIVWFVFPESPRWLAAKGRHEEASQIVDRIAKFNSWAKEDMNDLLQKDTEGDETQRAANITDLFRTPVLRKRILFLCVIWFAHIMTFYALAYNLGSFYHDLRVSLLISQVIAFPMLIVPISLVDVVGRQILTFSFLFVGGVACLAMTPLVGQGGGSIALLIVALIGKMSVVSQFFVSYLYTQELMPTVVRSQGLGLASTISRIGGMLAPQIALLDDLWPASSAVILGVSALIGATIALLLPDTTDSELPQSIADGEGFKARHVFKFDYPRRRHKMMYVDEGQGEDKEEVANA